jgi:cytochrome c oxidase assembly protein subunit 15
LDRKIKNFRNFALASTLTTYFLIFVGGLVRVSGAGLGCPDWPKCFGRWIPPLHVSQIPADFNVATFNLTLAWIEYINRLIGMIAGILIVITAVLAIKNFRRIKKILTPSILAAVLVAFQGWYGSVVVSSQLQSITVSVHLLLALLIVSLLIYVTQSSYYMESVAIKSPSKKSRYIKSLVLGLWGLIIAQIILGTQVRSQIENLLDKFPLLMGEELLLRIESIHFFHAIFGIVLVSVTVFVAFKLLKMESDFIRINYWILVMLMMVQILFGALLALKGLPQLLQVFHLWIASLIIGIVLILYTELSNRLVD